jgi:alpha-glucoside transport system permease protein
VTTEAPAAPVAAKKTKAPRGEVNIGRAHPAVRISVLIICVGWLIPSIGVLVTSFRTVDAANTSGWWTVLLHPAEWTQFTLENYQTAWNVANLDSAFVNSLAIALPATFIPILIASFAAYAFTFMEFRGKEFLFILIVSLLVVPNYVALVPMLKIYGQTGLGGTFAAAWLAHIGFGMSLAIYIFRNYMSTLPRSVFESAQIDGASHYQTFYKLVLPMSVPALASFAIFQFLWVWNDLLVALVFVGPGPHEPITVAVSKLLGQQGQGWNNVTAAGIISMILPLAVFLGLQRYFVRGLTAGSVKG